MINLDFSYEDVFASFTREPWQHQARSVYEVLSKFASGTRSVVLGAPTGAGKGLITTGLINLIGSRGGKTIVYNSRRLLTQQSFDRLVDDGINAGTRAASLKDSYDPNAPVQIAQLQTDIARVMNQECWDLYDADLVVIDEAHMAMSEKPINLIQRHLANGAVILGLTGTPINMSGVYRDIVVAATNTELRACGAHVPARCYSVHEMDVSKIRKEKNGEFSEGDIVKECWNQAIVGFIYEDWRRLNPDGLPTLCAAPGIGESIWVANKFLSANNGSEISNGLAKKGLRVAHIDCEKVVVNGETYANDAKGTVRNQVIEDAKKGEYDIVCHCQVIQEGVDWPDLRHLILARPYGSLANCIQSCGRAIRGAPGKTECVIQDHGGNMVRHGSPNSDRDWAELFKMTEKEISDQRIKDVREKKEPKPIVCPNCGAMRKTGLQCHNCGNMADPRVRRIVEKDGNLVERIVDEFAPPPPPKPKELTNLNSVFFKLRRASGKAPSEQQVMAVYKRTYGDYPPPHICETWRNERMAYRQRMENGNH